MEQKKNTDTRKTVRTVTSNDFITAMGIEEMTLKARKLLYIAISQCKKNDQEFFEYQINAKDFAKLMDIEPDNVYREADKITDELMKSFIRLEKPQNNQKKKSYLKLQLFDMCQYENGLLYFQISKKMTGYFLNLKKDFTKPLLNDFLKMKSNYSIEIWHLIQREMKSIKPNSTDIIQFDLSLEELRTVTGTQDKLKQMVHFKDKCFDKALREIYDNCGVNITYQNIRIGRKIVGFRCTAVSAVHIDTDNIPDDVKERARQGKERIRNSQKGEKI